MPSRSISWFVAILLIAVLLAAAGIITWEVSNYDCHKLDVITESSSKPVTGKQSGPTFFVPKFRGRELQILDFPHFTIGYDNQRKNPAWVVYQLDGPIVHANRSPVRPRFQTDFRTSAHVSDTDFINCGFDRGHMVPAYAMWSRFGSEAFISTFTLSNVVPQKHHMNAGIWEDLEDNIAGQSRSDGVVDQGYAGRFRNITVINGPIYGEQPGQLRNGTWVPASCFSIVLDYQEDSCHWRAMAFEIPNRDDVKGPLNRWLTTAKRIEDKTGIDFFEGNEEVRSQVEAVQAEKVW